MSNEEFQETRVYWKRGDSLEMGYHFYPMEGRLDKSLSKIFVET